MTEYVFMIGMHRTATTTVSTAFKSLKWNVLKVDTRHIDVCLKKGVHFKKHTFISDFLWIHSKKMFEEALWRVNKLHKQYPNAKFILNIRDVDRWLESSCAVLIEQRYRNPDFTPENLRVKKQRWYEYHSEVLKLFCDTPERLLIVNIDKSNIIVEISKFCHLPQLDKYNHIHVNKRKVRFNLPDDPWFSKSSDTTGIEKNDNDVRPTTSNIIEPTNIYGTCIPSDVFVGPFVEIQKNCVIGSKTRISSHSFLCENVHIGDNCFIGHGVMFTNDKFSSSTKSNERPEQYLPTTIGDNVRIGSNATILPVEIGDNAVIGAGAVVTCNVDANTTVVGNPARPLQDKRNDGKYFRLTDVRQINQPYEKSFQDVFHSVLQNGKYSVGKHTEELEQTLQELLDVPFAVAVGSGTAALDLVAEELNFCSEDEVIVQSNAFIASVSCIAKNNVTLVMTDVAMDGSINLVDVERLITKKTKALLLVHLYGDVVADLEKARSLCDKNNIILIEDCAQALGSKWKSRMVGSYGDISCFSFNATKNIGAIGEAGAVVTKNKTWYQNIRKRRNLGSEIRYNYELLGTNAKMDELQAGFINCKIRDLETIVVQKQELAKSYDKYLGLSGLLKRIIINKDNHNICHSHHLMVYFVKNNQRDQLLAFLQDNNIEALIHYPIPFHRSEAMQIKKDKIRGATNNSEILSKNVLSLPMHPALCEEDIKHICTKILQFEKQ